MKIALEGETDDMTLKNPRPWLFFKLEELYRRGNIMEISRVFIGSCTEIMGRATYGKDVHSLTGEVPAQMKHLTLISNIALCT